MTLITVLISLFLERFVGYLDDFRSLDWFHDYARRVQGLLGGIGDGPIGVILILALPLLLISLIVSTFSGVMLGLISILFGVLVLVFCLGPKDLELQVQSYIEAGIMEDEARILRISAELLGTDELPAGAAERDRAVAEAVFVQANRRLFGVLFWFIAFGPLGAVLYRLSEQLQARAAFGEAFTLAAARWVALLDWAPARLTALCYALTGQFDDTLPVVRKYLLGGFASMAQDNTALLKDAGAQALELDKYLNEETDATGVGIALNAATNLLTRTLIVWVVVLALLTLGGWTR